jgi:hypothetical protein
LYLYCVGLRCEAVGWLAGWEEVGKANYLGTKDEFHRLADKTESANAASSAEAASERRVY